MFPPASIYERRKRYRSGGYTVLSIFRVVRPHHYIKNFLVFLPAIFSPQPFWGIFLYKLLPGFFVFSLLSSFVYIFNDINDISEDRNHVYKRERPIASGKISKKTAVMVGVIFLSCGFLINAFISQTHFATSFLLALYFTLNIGYSSGLKRVPYIDVLILAVGFILRIAYGSLLTQTNVSLWLVLSIFFLSLYLGYGKRRNELLYQGVSARKVLTRYRGPVLGKLMLLFLVLTFVFYFLWCTVPGIPASEYLFVIYLTIPVVLFILVRFFGIMNGNARGDPVDILLKDKTIQIAALVYGGIMLLALR
jgi:4-hydroxybenzoate polyprenyltransferase